ncbi:MAG: terminase large subunit [Thermoplasmatales archaeon]
MTNEYILKSPTLFAIKILNFTPTKYQAQILEDDAERIMIIGARQIGKSTILSIKAIWRALTHNNEEILILAPTFRQAQIVFNKVYEMINKNEFLRRHTKKLTMNEIRLDNDSVIRCLPAGNEGMFIRGYSATVVMFDEASLIPDEIYVAVQPSLAVRGAQIIMSGTPYGKRGFMWEIYKSEKESKKKKWHIYTIKSSESFIPKDFLDEMRKVMTREQYAQEFEAEFIDNEGMMFPYTLVDSVSYDYEYVLPAERKIETDKYYMGIDPARKGSDETGIVIVKHDEVNGTYEVVWAEGKHFSELSETAGYVIDIYKKSAINEIYVDSTGVGAGLFDMLYEKLGDVVHEVVFSTNTRNEMYNNIKILMQQKRIRLNRADRKFLNEFSGFTVKYTSEGKEKIVKDENSLDDLVDALALACYKTSMYRVMVADELMEYINRVSEYASGDIYRWRE